MSVADRDFYLITLNFLVIWARESDIFLRTKQSQELYEFLLYKVKTNRDEPVI